MDSLGAKELFHVDYDRGDCNDKLPRGVAVLVFGKCWTGLPGKLGPFVPSREADYVGIVFKALLIII